MKSSLLAALCLLTPSAALAAGEAELANPAAVFCIEVGGEHVVETEADGQRGYCVLPDGSKIDAWDYFRENWDKAASEG